jgi:hypothetical protein
VSIDIASLDDLRQELRRRVTIVSFLAEHGHHLRPTPRGGATGRCPFHDDHSPSFSVYIDPSTGTERFRCHGCGQRGDIFDLVRLWDNHPDHLTTLHALATRHGIPWPEPNPALARRRTVMARAADFYARHLGPDILHALADRGFPEDFVRARRIGYAPGGAERYMRLLADAAAKAGMLDAALEAGLVVPHPQGPRDFFWSPSCGYIIFPNTAGPHVIGLQGRAHPTAPDRSKYLNPAGSRHQLYNRDGARAERVILCEGIPDTLSVLLAQLPRTGACGILGTEGWRADFSPYFARARRIYVALDRDAHHRAIALALEFGTRGRLLTPPQELGPKGDMNDWLVSLARRDPQEFARQLETALATAPTAFSALVGLIPERTAAWEVEDTVLLPGTPPFTGIDLLRELGHTSPLFRAAHLRLLAHRLGLDPETLERAALELAHANGTPYDHPGSNGQGKEELCEDPSISA